MSKKNSRPGVEYLDREEPELIESIQRDEWASVTNLPDAVAEARSVVTSVLHKYVSGRLTEKAIIEK